MIRKNIIRLRRVENIIDAIPVSPFKNLMYDIFDKSMVRNPLLKLILANTAKTIAIILARTNRITYPFFCFKGENTQSIKYLIL
ncbi:MAG: hypothetical protein IKC49_01670 [Clostridia bacterium]|nr:hypothetical protein [Clostridia bacterium]